MSEGLKCPKCGHEIDRANPVCPGCGAKLKFRPLNLPETSTAPSLGITKSVAETGRPLPPPATGGIHRERPSGADQSHPVPPPVEKPRRTADAGKAPRGFVGAWARGWMFSFKGRASRKEYWLRQVSLLLEALLVWVVAGIWGAMRESALPGLFVLAWLLAVMVPCWALLVRRLHDAGIPGCLAAGRPIVIALWFARAVIPVLYELEVVSFGVALQANDIATWAIMLSWIEGALEIVFGLLPSVPGTNAHGPNPYGVTVDPRAAPVQPVFAKLAGLFGHLRSAAGKGIAKAPGLVNRFLTPSPTCLGCGAKIPPGKKFCPQCGQAVPAGGTCRKCGGKVKPGQKFCPQCGQPFSGTCRGCGGMVETGQKFCPKCGLPVVLEEVSCQKCGTKLESGQKFCPHCGTAVAGNANAPDGEIKEPTAQPPASPTD